MKKRTAFIFVSLVFLATIVGAFFVYPNSAWQGLQKLSPWRLGLDLVGGAHLVYTIDFSQVDAADRADVAAGIRDVIERRVNLFGVSEPRVAISTAGEVYYLNVDLAGISDVSEAINQIGQTPLLQFMETQTAQDGTTQYVPTQLTGRYLKSAQIDFNQTTGRAQVAIEFDSEGAKLFEDITTRNVGKTLAIFVDGSLISDPVVNEKIAGGSAVISSPTFTTASAKELARNLNAGALPAPIELVNQQSVGATLGKASLEKSLLAGAIGTLLIVLFMLVYYGFFGVLASLALIVYVILSLSIFKIFVTMSLAGIAGFLLSIGMAVDANILIFERTKEELKKGVSRVAAITEGFRRAWPSIRDSNISTIITSLILFFFTSSFVKGLALTLLLGVLISMFTAITVTRGLMTIFVRTKKEKDLSTS